MMLLVVLCCGLVLAMELAVQKSSFEKFVGTSQRLLAAGDVLAVGAFYDALQAKRAQSKTRTHMILTRLNASLATAAATFTASVPQSTYDWVVLAAGDFYQATTKQANKLLRACAPWTHYGVLLWARATFNETAVCYGTDFVFVDDQSQLTGHSAHVYNLKRLIGGPTLYFPFQYTSEVPINWTDVVTVRGVEFRAHVPARLQTSLRTSDIVIIVNSGKPEQRDAIRATWASSDVQSRLAIAVVFVVALPTAALAREAAVYGDTMILEAAEGYNRSWSVLPLKGHGARQVLLNYATAAAWFFRCDDDTYVNTRNLFAFLNRPNVAMTFANTTAYIGCAFDGAPLRNATGAQEKWNADYQVYRAHRYPRYMSGGAGYVLSRKAAVCISAAIRSTEWQFFDREDVLTRLTLAAHCSPIAVESRCDLFIPRYVDRPALEFVSVHYAQPPPLMYSTHQVTILAPSAQD